MIRELIKTFYDKRKLSSFRKSWRENNSHNSTWVENCFDMSKVTVGKETYGPLKISSYGSNNCNLQIGSYCSIAHDVKFLLGGEHNYHIVSTFPFYNNVLKEQKDTTNKGDIIIGDDVWIGENVLIISGTKVGQGAVIAAGAIVVKNIPPYAIAGGNPARVIKYRCDEEKRNKLLNCDFSKMTEIMIKDNIDKLYTNVEEADISWIPQKDRKDLMGE